MSSIDQVYGARDGDVDWSYRQNRVGHPFELLSVKIWLIFDLLCLEAVNWLDIERRHHPQTDAYLYNQSRYCLCQV